MICQYTEKDWFLIERLNVTSSGKDVEKREHLYNVGMNIY
jgi:hypothetical protein